MNDERPLVVTKKIALATIIDRYRELHPGPFLVDSVAAWAMANKLYPVPPRNATAGEVARWRALLRAAPRTPV